MSSDPTSKVNYNPLPTLTQEQQPDKTHADEARMELAIFRLYQAAIRVGERAEEAEEEAIEAKQAEGSKQAA